jgi:hypothetical protein
MLRLVGLHRGFRAWPESAVCRARIGRRAGAAEFEQALLQAAHRVTHPAAPQERRVGIRRHALPGVVADDAIGHQPLALLKGHHGIAGNGAEHAVDLVEAESLHHDEDCLGALDVPSERADRKPGTTVHGFLLWRSARHQLSLEK